MSTASFKVEQIDSRTVTTKYGPKNTYTLVGSDGNKYSFPFTDPAKSGISVGTVVSGPVKSTKFGFELDPKTVTVGGEVVEGASPAPVRPSTGSYGRPEKPFPLPKTHGDTAIIRQNALTNAVATVADFVATRPTEEWPDLDKWTEMVITTAYKYAEFSSGQREVERIKAMYGAGVTAADIHTATDSEDA